MEKLKNRNGLVARPLAPEDVRVGQYVCTLQFVVECVAPAELDSWRPPRLIRLQCLPFNTEPQRVLAVCLPFVFVRCVDGDLETIDVRRHSLARVSKSFGQLAFKKAKAARDKAKADV